MSDTALASPKGCDGVPEEIMVVDDNSDNLKLLSSFLAEHGYRVRPATSGAMALRSAVAKVPDLILLDVRMPDMDGYTICRSLKRDENLRVVPVIFISALYETGDKIQGFEAGGIDYLTKPFVPAEVLARVRTQLDLRCLQRRQLRAQADLEERVAARTADLERASLALKESEERLRLVFEATSDGVWDLNVTTGEAFFSDRWYTMLGFAPGEFAANYEAWRERVQIEDRSATELVLRDHLNGHLPEYSVELRMRNRSGDWQWVLCRGKVIELDVDGRPTRMVGTHVDITERKRAEAQIAAALREKEMLLKEISHRVKNNLQVISSLLAMQADIVRDTHVRNVLDESADRVRSIALVHEQLYCSRDQSSINYRAYVEQLAGHLSTAYEPLSHRVPIQAEIEEVNFGVEVAVPLALITTELVSNAYKHAFPHGASGQIKVALRRLPKGLLRLSVSDTGRGLSPDYSTSEGTSLGLRLVGMLTDQIEGRLDISSPGGACFEVTFRADGHVVSHIPNANIDKVKAA